MIVTAAAPDVLRGGCRAGLVERGRLLACTRIRQAALAISEVGGTALDSEVTGA